MKNMQIALWKWKKSYKIEMSWSFDKGDSENDK